ncbi:MAG: DUF1697 domain-containing protein [Acidobacteria bacterium]|nr:DUF1697 domain-containing protein [Acidobacteriota bacterium]
MPRYVALLRGINVGGKNMIKMEKLRETFAGLGFENVKTYINSGNIAFDCRSPRVSKGLTPDAILAAKIRTAIKTDFGFDISTMVRSMDEMNNIVNNNPYVGKFDDDRYCHVFFLEKALTAEQESLLMEHATNDEFITVHGNTVYNMLKISILDSALGKGFLDRKLKIVNTARNWRTTKTLAEL